MDENTWQDNYNTLKEMVLDEGRLVTYVSISKDLCVHVNESKRLLNHIVEHVKKTHPDIALNVNYILSGLTEGNNAITTVCSETDFASVRQKLKTVFFEHIYSVGKGSPSVDNVALMCVNKFEDFPLCTGVIKSNVCVKHSKDEICNFKSNSQEIAVPDTRVISTQAKVKAIKMEISKTANNEVKNHVKVSETKEIIKSEVTPPKSDKKASKSNKGIAGFFNKTNGVTKKSNNSNSTSLLSVVKQEKEDKPIEIKKQEKPIEIKVEKMDVEMEVPAKQPDSKINPSTDSKAKNKNLNNIKKNAKVDKKRKRVLHVSDSESDDEKNDPFADSTPVDNHALESDDEIPPTPTVNAVKITSGIVNPRKRKRIVDKTYTDEDGYILTKKEEVYESCSDTEFDVETKENKGNQVDDLPAKKPKVEISPSKKQNGTKNGKKKVSPPQKGKQATLMSFFKKA
ncbi:DNA polymerase delta subunit 3 [Plodia interpunctella]|uniref:DNA polymerase delta subunit 3 n=1 Tax=Plodia interpunctella TaxID=58824 RepID=UPI0023674263|nr:DNA polymerase delta subunit 3 [Plodia interpunctella]